MADFPYPVFTPGNWPKVNVNASGASINYWSAPDAADVSGAIVTLTNYINVVSGGLSAGTASADAALVAVTGIFGSLSILSQSIGAGIIGLFPGTTVTSSLKLLDTRIYNLEQTQPEAMIGYLTQTVITMSVGLFNDSNITDGSSSTGPYPTGTYNNLWGKFWPLSSSYYTLSGNLNSSASIWNSNTTSSLSSAFSTSFYTLSGSLDSSASIWNALSSSYYGWTGSINTSVSNSADVSASYWGTSGEVAPSGVGTYAAFWNLSASLNISASNWNASAFTTSTHWNPVGGVFDITGSLKASQGGQFSGSVEASASFIMKSPNGTRWNITIDNVGILSSTALP